MSVEIIVGDCVESMQRLKADGRSVNCCITSPPYWGLRNYGVDGQLGMEETPQKYVDGMVRVFGAVRDILTDDGTLWLNLGDSYASVGKHGGSSGGKHAKELHGETGVGRGKRDYGDGLKPKDLVGIPWRVAFALQADGWYLRQDIIWAKPNPMPESVTDRCTKAHEYIFMLSKSAKYFYDSEAVKEPAVSTDARKFTDGGNDKQRGHSRRHAGFNGRYAEKVLAEGAPLTRNRRSVWTVATKPYKGAHFATFPPKLIEPCVLAGCPRGGVVLDPFGGSGTTGEVAAKHSRNAILLELNPAYAELARERCKQSFGWD